MYRSRFAADNAAQLGSGNPYLLRKFLLCDVVPVA